jgi:acyl carrier protein
VVEKEFSVRIPNEALSNIHSLTELLQALDAQDECANP